MFEGYAPIFINVNFREIAIFLQYFLHFLMDAFNKGWHFPMQTTLKNGATPKPPVTKPVTGDCFAEGKPKLFSAGPLSLLRGYKGVKAQPAFVNMSLPFEGELEAQSECRCQR